MDLWLAAYQMQAHGIRSQFYGFEQDDSLGVAELAFFRAFFEHSLITSSDQMVLLSRVGKLRRRASERKRRES